MLNNYTQGQDPGYASSDLEPVQTRKKVHFDFKGRVFLMKEPEDISLSSAQWADEIAVGGGQLEALEAADFRSINISNIDGDSSKSRLRQGSARKTVESPR